MTSSIPYKILCFFVNYGNTQTQYLDKILNELDLIEDCEFHKYIFSTSNYNFKQKYITNYILPESVGTDLTLQPYIFLNNNKDYVENFDYILYNENDNFISKLNFIEFLKFNNFLEPYDKCSGFIRYEINEDGFKYIVDPNNIESIIEIDGIKFFTINNIHSGCWLLSKQQYKKYIEKNLINIGSTLEDRASNVYKSNIYPGTFWGIEKLFPVNGYKDLLIHHMPNKYTHIPDSVAGKINVDNFVNV